VAKIDEPGSGNPRIEWHAGLAFRPHSPELATLDQGDKYIRLWHLDLSILQDIASATPAVHYTRAKIVLVGESNIGKSCLALRLKEDRYEGEMATTHGLQFWILPANELSPSILPPPGERREVILWDMGGQEVYSLVHQIFLSDTALALVAFDPTRGTAAFQEAEAWSKRLDQHFKGANVTKLLVGTRLDDESVVIDYARTEQLIKEGGFAGFYPTSAKTCRGIPELREAMAESLNWQNLLRNSRPDLFRRIRDKIQDLTDQGTVVVLYDTLMEQVRRESQSQEDFEEAAVDTVVKQLSMQGVIVHTRLASGERALVLDIGEVERYGCSVVIVARDNLRGVPAVEERMLAKRWMKFPRIEEDQRLPRGKECAVLEAVIQLLLEHGICLRHERMLVFPSLFQPWSGGEQTAVLSSALLFYELVGGIDNIYASLVSRLAVSGRFGLMRLWVDEAEFERAGRGACGLRRVARGSGYAHLDVRFEEKVPDKTRELFVQFVKKHLRQSGVRIVEHLDVTCACGYRFPELVILERLHQNLADVGCPNCDRRTLLSDAARSGVAKDSNLKDAIRVLEEKVTRVTQLNIDRAKDYFKDRDRRSPRQPIRILHLSDLHMNDKSDPRGMLPLLIADLTNTDGGLGIDVLNYLVVSGDLTCQAAPLEFDKAREFVSGLIERFRKALTYERCIIVPGNHDVDWSVQAYSWRGRRPGDTAHLEPGTYVESEKVLLVRDDEAYRLRFQSFSDNFYHPLVQQPYPLPYRDQCIPFFFPFTRIQFLAINSCWETDEFHPDRASIDFSSLASGLQKAEEQIEQARRRRSGGDLPVLRIAVWHHPIYDSGGLELEPFLSYLQTAHVRLGLHGHVHEDRANLARHLSRQPIHIVGAGSLGASSGQLPPATPNLYNLIEIWSDAKTKNHTKIRVRTRCQKYPKGPWGPYPGWPSKTPGEYRDFYEIDLH
jgi:small GTP-binding protein